MRLLKVEKSDLKEINKLIEIEFPYTKKSEKPVESRFSDDSFSFYKLVDDGKLIGFVEFQVFGKAAFLRGFVVAPECRKKGYGGKILNYAIDEMKKQKFNEINLLVARDNSAAKKLYEKSGFKKSRDHHKKIDGKEVEEMRLLLG